MIKRAALFAITGLCLAASFASAQQMPLTPGAPAAVTPLHLTASGDELCEARLFGRKARLWLQNGQPVRYQWSNRKALAASMSGNTITIAANPPATLSNVVIGQTSSGKKAIQGNWKFKSNTQDNVTFTCMPK